MDIGTQPAQYDPWSTEYRSWCRGRCRHSNKPCDHLRPIAAQRLSAGLIRLPTAERVSLSLRVRQRGEPCHIAVLLHALRRLPVPANATKTSIKGDPNATSARSSLPRRRIQAVVSTASAEFLISYPYQCGSFSPKTTKRMGAIAACDLHRDRPALRRYNFIFGHISIWHGFHKNARANRTILTIARPRCRDGQRGGRSETRCIDGDDI